MASVGQQTRERIIHAAVMLLWEQSYQGTSVDTLCARAKVKKGSFYHFFKSKTDLAVAAIESSWDHTQQSVFIPIFGNNDDGMEQLQKLIDKVDAVQSSILKSGGSYLGCPFGNLGQEMATKDEQIRKSTQKVFEGHCGYIAKALQRAQDKGSIPTGDNLQKAINIFALFEGALLLAKVANDPGIFRSATSSIQSIAMSRGLK